MCQCIPQKLGIGNKISIKNGNEFPRGGLQAVVEGSGFETGTVLTANMMESKLWTFQTGQKSLNQVGRFILGIIQDLDFQQLSRVVQPRYGFQQAFYYVFFIVQWQLNGYPGKSSDSRKLSVGGTPMSEGMRQENKFMDDMNQENQIKNEP